MKNILNIASYILNIVLIIFFAYSYFGNKQSEDEFVETEEDKIESIIYAIMEQERADLPLLVQEFDHVHSITIDSMVVTNNVEPYSAYLVTTWDMDEKQKLSIRQWAANGHMDKYIRKTKTVYVEVGNITTDKEKISWNTNWIGARMSVMKSE